MAEAFPKRLKELREGVNLTRHELGDMIGASQSQIWRYENGKMDPSIDKLHRICKVLQVSADYLLGFSDDESVDTTSGMKQMIDYRSYVYVFNRHLKLMEGRIKMNRESAELLYRFRRLKPEQKQAVFNFIKLIQPDPPELSEKSGANQ